MTDTPAQTLTPERAALLQDYACGTMTWATLRTMGFENYFDVLAGLGELGLRPPIAEMTGPNVASRERGRAMIRRLLADAPRA
jgi:hypothetical protein